MCYNQLYSFRSAYKDLPILTSPFGEIKIFLVDKCGGFSGRLDQANRMPDKTCGVNIRIDGLKRIRD